jgi:hypothetical protein
MKFCMAAFLPAAALAFSTTGSSSSQRRSTRLAADAVATATYTFTKSEEIFAEAKTVRRSRALEDERADWCVDKPTY